MAASEIRTYYFICLITQKMMTMKTMTALKTFWDQNHVSELIEQECHPSMKASSTSHVQLSIRLALPEQAEEIRGV